MFFELQIRKILPLFSEDQQIYIEELLHYGTVDLEKDEKYILLKIINSIDENITENKKLYLIEILEKTFVDDNTANFCIANQHEDFHIQVRLRKSDNFTDTILLIRESETNEILSDPSLAGSEERLQVISCIDLPLEPNNFYKLRVLTESPLGNGLFLIDTIYLYVEESIGEELTSIPVTYPQDVTIDDEDKDTNFGLEESIKITVNDIGVT